MERRSRNGLTRVIRYGFSSLAGGYILALLAVPFVLSAVGFMEFRTGDFDVNPTLGIVLTLFTALPLSA